MSTHLPVRRNGPGDPTPATYVHLPDKGPTVLDRSCEDVYGVPQCWGAVHRGPRGCTCSELSELDRLWCRREARRQLEARDYSPCDDCAFRKGSPEQEAGMLERLLDQGVPFHCHRGMPMRWADGEVLQYRPDRDEDGVPRAYPVCMGWLSGTLARVYDDAS